jgi:hypothetical protein
MTTNKQQASIIPTAAQCKFLFFIH